MNAVFRIIFTLAIKSVSFKNNLVAFTIFFIPFGVKVNWYKISLSYPSRIGILNVI